MSPNPNEGTVRRSGMLAWRVSADVRFRGEPVLSESHVRAVYSTECSGVPLSSVQRIFILISGVLTVDATRIVMK